MTKNPRQVDLEDAIRARGSEPPILRIEDGRPAYDFYKTSGVRNDMTQFEPSLTRQEFAEECDINVLMERYESTGVISHVNRAQPMFLDTTEYPTLQGAMDLFRQAAESFNGLPAKVRREFENDPQKFVDFASDPANVARLREWGLAAPEPVPDAPIRVEMVNPAPPEADASVRAPEAKKPA